MFTGHLKSPPMKLKIEVPWRLFTPEESELVEYVLSQDMTPDMWRVVFQSPALEAVALTWLHNMKHPDLTIGCDIAPAQGFIMRRETWKTKHIRPGEMQQGIDMMTQKLIDDAKEFASHVKLQELDFIPEVLTGS